MKIKFQAVLQKSLALFIAAYNYFVQKYVYYCIRINPRMKCPACGVRSKHKIQFHAILRILIHTCGRCSASWGENPVFAADHWAPKYEEAEAEDVSLDQPPSADSLARKRVN